MQQSSLSNIMRIYFLILIALLSCNTNFAQDNSAEIIRYANNVIALTNQYYQKVNAYQKKVAQLEKDRDKAEIDKETPIHFECADGKTQTTRLFRDATNPPTALLAMILMVVILNKMNL